MKISEKQLKEVIKTSIKKYFRQMDNGVKARIDGEIPKFVHKVPSYADTEYVMKHINEGLITTYPYEKVIKSLKRNFNLRDEQVDYETINDEGNYVTLIDIILPLNISNSELGNIEHFMNTCGYFKAMDLERIENTKYGTIIFEPKYSNDISNKIREKCSVIYHSTSNTVLPKILKNGLVPKYRNALFFYPDRLYCMKGDCLSIDQIYTLKNVQLTRNNKRPQDDNPFDKLEYSLLTIDVKKIPKNVKMYSDPMAPKAIFTYDIIPPEAIINITPFTLNNNI